MSRQSIRSTTSATSEFGGVVPAVEHLQELGKRMRSEGFDFKEDDVSNIDIVVDSIYGLEKERLRLHEILETQTIRGSVLRHRLLFYPNEIQKEIDEAVISARQSNAEAQKNLQESLEAIYKDVEFLEERQSQLEKENAVLHPERELIRQQHEEIISQLNQRMAEKAGMQITLNETRDKVRQANQCILELEDGIIQLKEDLILERQDARDEKKRLKSAVNETTKKTKEQKAENFKKKKELDRLKEELMESDGQLQMLKKSVRRLENSRAKLEDKEKVLSLNLKKETGGNATLRENGIAIRAEAKREDEEYEVQRTQLEDHIKQLDQSIAKQHKLSGVVEIEHAELELEVKGKMGTQTKNRARVKELEKMLHTAKDCLSNKAEDAGRLDNENQTLQTNIDEMHESHKVVISQLNSHIEEYREQLGRERKDRMDLQIQRDEVQKDLEELKQGSQSFMVEINKKINEGKTKHEKLSKEGTVLQKNLRDDDATIRRLQKELADKENEFTQTSTEKKGALETIEHEVAEMEVAVEDKKDMLASQTPAFQELEIEFEEKTLHYENMKKEIVKKKKEKAGLDDAIKRAMNDKEKVTNPRGEMKEILAKKRFESIDQLKSHAGETKDVETEIYVEGCKLTKVDQENYKFKQYIKKLEAGIEDMHLQQKENTRLSCTLQDELVKLKEELVNGWREDREMEQLYAERDEAVVRELANILVKTEKREIKIADISSQLESELMVLGDFLENVARRRPIDTREGKRPPRRSVDSIPTVTNVNTVNNNTTSQDKNTREGKRPPRRSVDSIPTVTNVNTVNNNTTSQDKS